MFLKRKRNSVSSARKRWKWSAPKPVMFSGFTAKNVKVRSKILRRSKKRRYKKKKGNLMPNKKQLMNMTMRNFSLNLFKVNEIEVNRGAIALPNTYVFGQPNVLRLPLLLMDLDTTFNANPTSVNPTFHQLTLFKVSATLPTNRKAYAFNPYVYTPSTNDGESVSINYTLQSESASLWGELPTNPIPKYYQKGYKLDFVFYGQNTIDTLFRVDIVRMPRLFADAIQRKQVDIAQYLPDHYLPTNANNNPEDADRDGWNKAWHSLIMPYVASPLATVGKQSEIKIIRSHFFKVPEKDTTHDRQNSIKTSIWIPTKRVINRKWRQVGGGGFSSSDYVNIDPEDPTGLNAENVNDENEFQYHTYGAIDSNYTNFLMIRATNPNQISETASNSVTVNVGAMPTFDCKIKVMYSNSRTV